MPDKKTKHDWLLLKCSTIGEKCDVTLPWQLNFWIESQQTFLTETAIFIVERWKKRLNYRFVPECSHALESHLSIFFGFTAIFVGHSLLRSRTFATMVTQHFSVGIRFNGAETILNLIYLNPFLLHTI